MRQHLLYTLAGLALLGFAAGANATVISGAVQIAGDTTVNFGTKTVSFGGGQATVTDGTDLSPMGGATVSGGMLTLSPIKWDGAFPATVWIFDDGTTNKFEFKLNSVGLDWSDTSTNSIHLSGYGTLYGNGFTANNNVGFSLLAGGTTGKQSYLSFTAASPVPVPAAGWLFGSAMLGLAGIAKRRKALKP
ncbi:VPLPA-CTERM sorting domain-containing protein [Thiorhodococcus fuscus]|uniref:VPLPA-CTERM sorting domain-containing protein n=1 Tax=Thiorhodococcus fuscus TaxID=527200 RepID=A0ABW4YAU0_9GAMM